MRSTAAMIVVTLGLVLGLGPGAPAQSGRKFRILDLGPSGRITQRVCHDFDGDGKAEILVFKAHTVRVYLPDGKGGYDPNNWNTIELPGDALCFAVGQVDQDPATDELVLVTPKGLVYYRVEKGVIGNGPHTLFLARSLVTAGQDDDVHWRGFLTDLDSDGLVDVALPGPQGFALFYQRRFGKEEAEEGKAKAGAPGKWPEKPDRLIAYAIRAALTVGAPGLTGRIEGTIGVPDFHVADFTGDGKTDFAVDDGRMLRVFPGGEDGRIEQEALPPVDLEELTGAGEGLPRFIVRDVNGDGILDYVVSRREEGRVEIFLGGGSLWTPVRDIEISGWCHDPELEDLDGDGRVDLILPTTPKVNYTTALNVMLSHTIEVANHIYLNTGEPDAPFPAQETANRRIRVPIRLYLTPTGRIAVDRSLLVNYRGDFNKDGRKDLVIRRGTTELRFYLGRKEGVFEEDDVYAVLIPDTDGYGSLGSNVMDLNGDGWLDIVIYYRSRDREGDRLVLVLSTGVGWK